VDGIAPAGTWGTWWQEQARARLAATPWKAAANPSRAERAEA
jgi:hypothetical protein